MVFRRVCFLGSVWDRKDYVPEAMVKFKVPNVHCNWDWGLLSRVKLPKKWRFFFD